MTDTADDLSASGALSPGRSVLHAQKLIRCPSITPADAGAIDYLKGVLEGLGFKCWHLPFQAKGTEPVDNLFARRGSGAPHLCFAGHTDVVPPGRVEDWTSPPFDAVIKDGVLFGRGASDMKGGVAAFVGAVEALIKADDPALQAGTLSFLITGDEEGPAINGTKPVMEWMQANGHVPDLCVVGEPTNNAALGEAIKIGRRGSLNGTITITGVQGHVAYQHLAANPVRALVHVCERLHALTLDSGTEHFLPTNLEVTSVDVGNPTVNIIPAEARAKFNVRYNDTHTADSLEAMLREMVAEAVGEVKQEGGSFSHELTFKRSGDAFMTEPGTASALLSEAIESVTGRVPTLSTSGGTSDARFIKDMCPVFEFGLINETIHQIDECARVVDIIQLEEIYTRFIRAYLGAARESASA